MIIFLKYSCLDPFDNHLGHIALQGISRHSLGLLDGILLIHNLHWNRLLRIFLGMVIALLGALSLFFKSTGSLRLQKATKPSQIGLFDQVSEVGMLVLDVDVGQVLLSEGSVTASALIRDSVDTMSFNLYNEWSDLGLLYHIIIIIIIYFNISWGLF
jgi:hypothetical protein